MGRSPCCDENGLKKGPWTPEEDKKLVEYVRRQGHGSWRALPKLAGLNRCGKSCRLRWTNYLRPDIKRGKFSEDEEQTIINLHSLLGNKWSTIASHLPGRTDNEIKNFWNTHLKKKLLRRGIDPITHRPRTDLQMFANLPHLIANLSTLTNSPSDINVLRLQSDVTQLAKIHILQTIFQVLSTNPAAQGPDLTTQLLGAAAAAAAAATATATGSTSMPLFQNDHLVDHLATGLSSPLLVDQGLANPAQLVSCGVSFLDVPDQLQLQALQNDKFHDQHSGENNGNIDPFGNASNSNAIAVGSNYNQMPPLVPGSPKSCTDVTIGGRQGKLNKPKENCSVNYNTPPSNSTTSTFEGWGELLDDEATNSYWNDIMEP
ncbi:hypothetical protein Ancab_009558 [Ancistrocladus abbreviatus]